MFVSMKDLVGVNISYLGGYWVLLEFKSLQTCEKFQTHNDINSWFSSLKHWNAQFEIPDRVVWIDVEGTPLQTWSHATFNKIASKWGEIVYIDDSNASNKYSMSLCVKTRVHHLIFESFKAILEGNISCLCKGSHSIAQSEDGSDYKLVENSPDHVENSHGQIENSLDHNSPNHVENSHVYVENSLENSAEQIENSPDHVENSYVHVENSLVHVENSHDVDPNEQIFNSLA
ncbi:RNA-directed DNA polymerase, eukaryota [Tanacetum coccineum]